MNIGATQHEVSQSKKVDIKDASRRSWSIRGEEQPTIYYYSANGREIDQKGLPTDIYVPIENYSANLIRLLDNRLTMINRSIDVDTVSVLVTLRSVIFPNKKEFELINPTRSITVWEMVKKYTRCIMQLVGQVAEYVLVDSCANNSMINRYCINVALFKDEILETYDIPYDDYVAYTTSDTKMIIKDPRDGIYKIKDNRYYNPHHTSQDIGWCKRDNIWDQLRTELDELRYVDNAKIQVKTTLNCDNLDLEHYMLTPVIVFDFDHGINKLKERYPHNLIYSAYDLFPEVAFQMEKYFQIIAAYVSGLTNKLNISETDLKNDIRLRMLFSTSVYEVTKKNRLLDKAGLIKLAQDADKPVIIGV